MTARGTASPALTVEAEVAVALERVLAAVEARRRHDVANALTTVEGAATVLLEDDLAAKDRAAMVRVLGSGVGRLRSLLLGDDERPGRASLRQVALDVARDSDRFGQVLVEVDRDLVAQASQEHVNEAVRQLARCGRQLAPAGPLILRGRRNVNTVEVWLQLARLTPSEPLPVAAHVAARLVQDHGGEVRATSGAEGGLAIGICLLAAPD